MPPYSFLQKQQGGRKDKRRSEYFCWQKLKTTTEHPKSFSLNNILMCLSTAESHCTIATPVCIHISTHIRIYRISRLGFLMKIVSVSLHSTEIVSDRIYTFHPLSTCIYTATPNSPNTVNLTQDMNGPRLGEEHRPDSCLPGHTSTYQMLPMQREHLLNSLQIVYDWQVE